MAKCQHIDIKHKGQCKKEKVCACPKNILPVCGEDNNTYDNECLACCKNIKIKHKGNCKTKIDCRLVRCGTMYEPVCGKKNLTYPNSCMMQCIFNDVLKHDGECKP